MKPALVIPAPTGLETYFGGKGAEGASQQIINQIQPHVAYVELFLGSGQVLRHLAPNGRTCTIGNDLDGRVVAAWRTAAPAGVEIHQLPALDLLAGLPARFPTGRVVVYADPPYPFCCRRGKRKKYRVEMRDEDHPVLLAALRGLPDNFDVLVSTYPNDIYAHHLAGWRVVEYTAQTQTGSATEHLYCNFPAPTALHDSRWAGKDYRERERIKKLAKRWGIRFARMPPADRQAVLQALLDTGEAPAHLVASPAPAMQAHSMPPPTPVVSSSPPSTLLASPGDARGHHQRGRAVPAPQLGLFV